MIAKCATRGLKSWLGSLWQTPGCCCLCQESDTNGLICDWCFILLVSNDHCCDVCAVPLQKPHLPVLPDNPPELLSAVNAMNSVSVASLTSIAGSYSAAEGSTPLSSCPTRPSLCAQCVMDLPSYRSAIVPWIFGFPMDFIIHELKYNARLEMGRLAGTLLSLELRRHFAESGLPDLVVPVPLTLDRLRKRGYNQVVELVRWFGADWVDLSHASLVWRRYDTPAQSELGRRARMSNLQNAFGCDTAVAGRSVLLVDDVMTTGATLEQLSLAVKEAGALTVDVCAVARTASIQSNK